MINSGLNVKEIEKEAIKMGYVSELICQWFHMNTKSFNLLDTLVQNGEVKNRRCYKKILRLK